MQRQVEPQSRATVDITAQALEAFHPGNDKKANAVSLTVETLDDSVFVAERPEYYNTAGMTPGFATQGGTDVFGFSG